MTWNALYKLSAKLMLLAIFGLLIVTLGAPVAQAQDPRPPAPGQGGGGAPSAEDGDDGDSDRDSVKPLVCGHVEGQVLNWGYQKVPEAPVVLKTGSWESSTLTTEWGDYTFTGLGVGIAKLNVILAPLDPLEPFAPDAYVYINCDYPTIANLGVYSGSEDETPVTFTMTATDEVITWNDRTRLTLTIENKLPTGISNVIVTDMMPFGLNPLNINTSADVPPENIKIVEGGDDGRLVVVYLDKIEAGATETITINVTAIEDTPLGTDIHNTATLFYRESVALQASVDLTVGSEIVPIPAATSGESSGMTARANAEMDEEMLRAKTATVGQSSPTTTRSERSTEKPSASTASTPAESHTSDEATVADETEPVTDSPAEEAESTDDLLPQTGNGRTNDTLTADSFTAGQSNLVGPLSGVGLVLLAFLAYGLRTLYWPTEQN